MFKIGNYSIGQNNKCFVIAEAGVNHNGDINLAKKMVDVAVEAGADAVKFQTFKSENLVTEYADMAEYQKNNLNIKQSQFNMLKQLELNYYEFIDIKQYCVNKGIIFLSTPFDFESAKFLNDIGMGAFKISSGDLTNIPFLEYIAKFKKPIILSSGMSKIEEISDALQCIYMQNNKDVAVLHCTSNYPAAINTVNLRAINTIKKRFDVLGGYSDHTEGIIISVSAVALGANIIEKHFTLDKNMKGPDHKASLEPSELKKMIFNIRKIEKALGNGVKIYSDSEKDTIKAARKSIVAARDVKKGAVLTFEDLNYKRPGDGLSPKYYKNLIGKKTNKYIRKDEQIILTSVIDK